MQSFTSGGQRIGVEWFAASRGSVTGRGTGTNGPAVLLLHGADGLSYAEGDRLAARTISASGYHVAFVHYLETAPVTSALPTRGCVRTFRSGPPPCWMP
jgi:hypothetical protein